MDQTKPQQTLNTPSKNSLQVLVFLKMLIQGLAVFKKCAKFMRSHFAPPLFLNSQNKLLIPGLFLSPAKWSVQVQPF
jgi:hypothetical protein